MKKLKHREVSNLWKNTQLIHDSFGNEIKEVWLQRVSKCEKGNVLIINLCFKSLTDKVCYYDVKGLSVLHFCMFFNSRSMDFSLFLRKFKELNSGFPNSF